MLYKLVYFVPESHLEITKQAVFASGAGEWGGYTQVCWQSLGAGQFIPQAGANPHLGVVGELEKVDEYRVEVLCPENVLATAISALTAAHPYEQPAIEALVLHYPVAILENTNEVS